MLRSLRSLGRLGTENTSRNRLCDFPYPIIPKPCHPLCQSDHFPQKTIKKYIYWPFFKLHLSPINLCAITKSFVWFPISYNPQNPVTSFVKLNISRKKYKKMAIFQSTFITTEYMCSYRYPILITKITRSQQPCNPLCHSKNRRQVKHFDVFTSTFTVPRVFLVMNLKRE